MDASTRSQLLALCEDFYTAQAMAFDASRGHHAWPGWKRLLESLTEMDRPLRVLDIGCGNARLARFLGDSGIDLDYTGVDANTALLESARDRLPAGLRERCRLTRHDFLVSEAPGTDLPAGPFDLVALMGVLHHVPGRDWRVALLRAAAQRVAPGGLLALATWQFADRERFARHRIDWSSLGPVRGRPIDETCLEAGDHLLRFGGDADAPPRFCHQVDDAEFESWPSALGLEPLASFRADGAEGNLNRYWILKRSSDSFEAS
jgi:tRNA (uracil-5-)-methyltransferase TRM9